MNNAAAPGVRVGVDIGGTFTDLVILTPDGRLEKRKIPSTPDDYAEAIIAGILDALGGAVDDGGDDVVGPVTGDVGDRLTGAEALDEVGGFDVQGVGHDADAGTFHARTLHAGSAFVHAPHALVAGLEAFGDAVLEAGEDGVGPGLVDASGGDGCFDARGCLVDDGGGAVVVGCR